MIFGRGRASYLYSMEKDIQGSQGKLRECSGFLKNDSGGFGEIPGSQRNLQEGFSKANKASVKPQSHPESSQGDWNIVCWLW